MVRFFSLAKCLIQKLYCAPKSENPKPANFRNNKVVYLRYLLRGHLWRWVRFSTIGTATTGVGFLILFLAVSHWGLRPILGYLIENAVMLQVGFLLNRYLTFGDRDTHWFKALFKWYGVRASTFGAGQGIFFLLVNIFGLQYMLASLTIAASLGLFSYAISNYFTFSGRLKPAYAKARI